MAIIYEKKLGILLELRDGPKHGYKLADELEISTGYVYSHLDELEEADLIEIAEKEESGRQRIYYRITENGRLLLRALGYNDEDG
ncbi:PadR family transcriptional regulator [Natrialbaceae archaeon A-arb3/5]